MGERPRVLVADDDADVRAMCRMILEGQGFEVSEAADGQEALERLQAQPRPDVLVLDLIMPERTGWGTFAEIQRDPATKDTPVVIVTAQADEDYRRRALELGVIAYVLKPFQPRELVNAVRTALFGGSDRRGDMGADR